MTQPTHKNHLDNPIVLGLVRATSLFPIEHFVDMTKTSAQKSPHLTSLQVITSIYKARGLSGFADGAMPNFPRRVARDTVRWPIVGYTYHVLTSNFPNTFPEKSTTSSIFSGIATASFDALVLGPLENLMAFRIKEGRNYSTFLTQNRITSLYQGALVNLFYRTTIWSIYMGMNSEIEKKFSVLNKKNLPPYAKEITSVVTVATTLVVVAMPLDFLKTRIQMDTELQNKKITFVVQKLLKDHGFRRFYAGAPIAWSWNLVYVFIFQKIVQKSINYFKET